MGFGLALAILVAIGGVSYRSIAKLTDTARWVNHSHEVLQTIDGVVSTLVDAETGQRGYVMTGEERYLEPFTAAQKAIAPKIKALRRPDQGQLFNQQRWLDLLDPLIAGPDGKFAELEETIAARRDKSRGFEARLEDCTDGQGKECDGSN